MPLSLYDRFVAAYKARYEREITSKTKLQQNYNARWKSLKDSFSKNKAALDNAVNAEINRLRQETTSNSIKSRFFFLQASTSAQSAKRSLSDDDTTASGGEHASKKSAKHDGKPRQTEGRLIHNVSGPSNVGKGEPSIVCSDDESEQSADIDDPTEPSNPRSSILSGRVYEKSKQEALKNEITVLESDLNSLITRRDIVGSDATLDDEITEKRKMLDLLKKSLRRREMMTSAQQRTREKQRQELQELREKNSDFSGGREKAGRPRLEEAQSGLLQAICDIAIQTGSAADRRRSIAIQACTTLDDLHKELVHMGFTLSRSATYLRLLPRRSSSNEGARHIKTVPVKLCRAQSDLHRDHADQHFCRATINSIEQIASVLGPKQVFFLSQDDKAKVPIGRTAAKLQAPLLMHLDYKIRLPDHDFVVGQRHNLTPSVYAGIEVTPHRLGKEGAVTFSGPTYIAIRSARHSSSTASSHAKDLCRLVTLPEFKPLAVGDDGRAKPVLFVSVDGGPDENPRYSKVIAHAITHFKDMDLDALLIFTNAPGRSAFNRVERRMAPLSRALSGVILRHETYGTHLDQAGKTVDRALELRNFEHAGKTLAEIWSEMKLDEHPVVAEYIGSDEVLPVPLTVSESWYLDHVRESQYLLQIVKCDDRECCDPHRSGWRKVVHQRFLPAPFPFDQDSFVIPSPEDHKTERFPPFTVRQMMTLRPKFSSFREIPYDLYCPSQKDNITKRTCSDCGVYFASNSAVIKHRKHLHKAGPQSTQRVTPLRILSKRPSEVLCVLSEDILEWVDVEEVNLDVARPSDEVQEEPPIPIINDMKEWLKGGAPFTEAEPDNY